MKKIINQFTAKFLSRSANESFARATAAAFIAQLDPTLDEINDIKTAVSEAVTNAIVHGYRDALGEIVMTVRLIEPSTAEIIIRDRGCGIDDIAQAREPMFTTGGVERSGMGFTIMESFMDRLSVKSGANRGTVVRMKKVLHVRGEKK